MKYKVAFDITEDRNGITGFFPSGHDYDKFDSFWTAIGIFHDVFEHYFEGRKYFNGNEFCTIGGEIVAMGHFLYYTNTMGLSNRFIAFSGLIEPAIDGTNEFIEEDIRYGRYGIEKSDFNLSIPRQKKSDWIVEKTINEHYQRIKRMKVMDSEDPERAKMFIKSIRKSYLANCYRLGYKMAKRIDSGNNNYYVLHEFIELWRKIIERTDPEGLSSFFNKAIFTVNTRPQIKWKCELVGYGSKAIVTENTRLYDLSELIYY